MAKMETKPKGAIEAKGRGKKEGATRLFSIDTLSY